MATDDVMMDGMDDDLDGGDDEIARLKAAAADIDRVSHLATPCAVLTVADVRS